MIIVGSRRRNRVMGQLRYTCKKCQQDAFHSVVRTRLFFTAFFIPLFPIGKYSTARCNLCGFQEKVDNKEMDAKFPKQSAAPNPR